MAKSGAELVKAQIKAKRSMITRLEDEIKALEALVPADTRQVEMPVTSNHKAGK